VAALDDFLSWTMVLMHFPENVNNHGPRDNVFWGSCPGLIQRIHFLQLIHPGLNPHTPFCALLERGSAG
jgi:hypothetical protein